MQKPLDPLRFKENVYERPNQDWICGHAAEGLTCPLGPDARGNCRHTGECIPAKKGDRWMCARSEARGGKCAEGPLPDGTCAHLMPPCQPVRSLRRSRGVFVWLMVALTTGALLVLFGNHFRHFWMDPGSLTNAHATSATKCSDCHALKQPAFQRIIPVVLNNRARTDGALCLKCHALGPQPFYSHSVSPATLAMLTNKLKSSNKSTRQPILLRASQALAPKGARAGDIACATCHQEHHGRKFDLRRLTNAQCQVCHSVRFASFKSGHPDFAGYPYQRRTRIFFDHNSHLQQHFAEKKEKAPNGCQDCHVPGEGGRFMRVRTFDVSCAGCHSGQIKGEGMTVKGVAFFTVPGIDAETLAAKGISIGEWPKFADGKITPFMGLVLSRQSAARAAIEKLRGVDLLDLTKATPEQLAAAEQFAWAVKSLLFNLVVEGQSYLMKQMKNDVASAGLEVPRAALMMAQKEWMPHLLTDVANYQNGIKPPLPEKAKLAPAPSPTPPNDKSAPGDESLLGGEDLTSAPAPSPAKPAATTTSDLLAGDEDLASGSASATPSPSAGKSDDLTGGDLLQSPSTASPAPVVAASPTPEPVPAEEWVAAGGWYRPQESFTLFYRPIGHADPFLTAWLTAAARLQSATTTTETHNAFEKLADPQTPGLCMKCHTVDVSDGVTTVNWLPAQPNTKSRPFTTFSHITHLSLVGDAGCQTCHALNPKSQYAKFFSPHSETAAAPGDMKFQSNFSAVSKMLCAKCHQPRIAGDACIQCHRYHAAPVAGELAEVGRFRTSLGKQSPPGEKLSSQGRN